MCDTLPTENESAGRFGIFFEHLRLVSIRIFGSQNVCLGDGCGRKSPIEEGGKTSSRKHRLITRTPGRRVIVLTGCVSIVCIFIRELFLRKECAMFKKMRVASARRNDRVGLRTSLSA